MAGGGLIGLFGLGAVYSFKDMGTHAVERANKAVNSLRKDLKLTGDEALAFSKTAELGLVNMVGALKPLAAGAALVSWPVIFAKHAREFESEMLKVGQVARASSEDMELLKGKALEIGINTSKSASEAAQGMYELASAGFDTKQVLATVEPVLKLTTITGESFASMADVTTTALRAFNLTATDTEHITDAIIRLQQVSKFHYNEMGGAIGQVAGVAAGMNQKLETTMAWMGLFRNAGLSAEYSAFKLKMTLNSLVNPKSIKIAEALGVKMVDSAGKYKNLNTIMKDLIQATNKYSDAEVMSISRAMFGARNSDIIMKAREATYTSVENGVATTFKGIAAAEQFEKELIHSEGLTQKFAEERRALLTSQIAIMKNRFSAFSHVIGERALPMVTQWVTKLNDALLGMIHWAEAHPKTIDQIIRITGAMGKFLLVIGAARFTMGAFQAVYGTTGMVLRGTIGPLATLIGNYGKLSGVIGGIPTPNLAAGVIVASTVAVAAAVTYWYQYREEVEKTNKALETARQNEIRLMELMNKRLGLSMKNEESARAVAAGRAAVERGFREHKIWSNEQAAEVFKQAATASAMSAAAVQGGFGDAAEYAHKYARGVTGLAFVPGLAGAEQSAWEASERQKKDAYAKNILKEITPQIIDSAINNAKVPLGTPLYGLHGQAQRDAEAATKAQAAKDDAERARLKKFGVTGPQLPLEVLRMRAATGRTGPMSLQELKVDATQVASSLQGGPSAKTGVRSERDTIIQREAAIHPILGQLADAFLSPATATKTPSPTEAKIRDLALLTQPTSQPKTLSPSSGPGNTGFEGLLGGLGGQIAAALDAVLRKAEANHASQPISVKLVVDGKVLAETIAKQQQDASRLTGEAPRPRTLKDAWHNTGFSGAANYLMGGH